MLIEKLRVGVRIFFVFGSIIHWNDEFDNAVNCGFFVYVLSVGINQRHFRFLFYILLLISAEIMSTLKQS